MERSIIMTIEEYRDSLIGGLNDPEDVMAEIEEIKAAKIGHIKPNSWEKVSDNSIEVYWT